MPRPDERDPTRPDDVPTPLRAAAGLVLVEGLCTVMFGVVEGASTDSDRLALGLTSAVFFVAYGIALGGCAWGMWRLRPWSRSPAVLAQLIFLGLAWNVRSSAWPLALLAAVVAAMVLAGVLHPRSMEALNREEHRG